MCAHIGVFNKQLIKISLALKNRMLELHFESKTTKRLKFLKSNQTTKMIGFEKMTTKEKHAYSTWDSQAVSDPSTNQARRCLT